MKPRLLLSLFAIALFVTDLAFAQPGNPPDPPQVGTNQPFAGGSGTQSDPYQVGTAAQLDSVRHYPSSHFKQTANLDLNIAPYNSGSGWLPISGFTGSYDGGGYTISSLMINRTNTYNVGLFGTVTGGTIKNLGLIGARVMGRRYVGALVGYVTGGSVIRESYSKGGSVQASLRGGGLIGEAVGVTIATTYSSGMYIGPLNGMSGSSAVDLGGLAGEVQNCTVTNSYAINHVTGSEAGGLVGVSDAGSITTSYSASVVTGGTVGGLSGFNYGTTFTNSYYNSDSTVSGNSYGTGLTTTQMRSSSSFSGWDFSSTWVTVIEGHTFPKLQAFGYVKATFAGGSGTQADPYQVATVGQLDSVRHHPSAHFRQTADIDLGVAPFNTGTGWLPISHFSGSYDGDGYTISGLMINRPAADTVGLFAKLSGATLNSITLYNPSVTGRNVVGALVGTINSVASTVNEARITGGSVTGVTYLGGLAGVSKGSIDLSAATKMRISGSGHLIGGLVGYARGTGSSITNSYAVNKMSSSLAGSSPGGLVGYTSSTVIIGCYSASSGGEGIVVSNGGTITNSYYNSDSTTAGNKHGIPLTTTQMRQRASFTGWNFNGTWVIAEDSDFPKSLIFLAQDGVFAGGTGTGWDPFQIATANQLNSIRLATSGAYYRQTADISLNASPYNTGQGWSPIPDFYGGYDGNGYTISDLMINRPAADTVGLFAKLIGGGKLINLNLSNPSVTGRNVAGALVGAINSTNSVTSLVSGVRITGGSVTGSTYLGGLTGRSEGVIKASAATKMRISGSGYLIGGLVGYARGTGSAITYSYAVNKMSSSASGAFPGGLAGFTSSTVIIDSYTASSGIQGLVSSNGGTITNSYFNSDSSASSSNGTPLTTTQMRQRASFTNWDFTNIWAINEGNAFPDLQTYKSKAGSSHLVGTVPGGEEDPDLPRTVELQQNYPNPFNPVTTINYSIPEQSHVRMEVFDMMGRKVAMLVDGENKTAGRYNVRFDARNLASGMYIYRLQAGNTIITKKLTLIK